MAGTRRQRWSSIFEFGGFRVILGKGGSVGGMDGWENGKWLGLIGNVVRSDCLFGRYSGSAAPG